MPSQPQNILFLALSGIGNLLMQLPTIEAIKRKYPDSHITVWVAPRGTKPIIQHHKDIDDIIVSPISRSLLLQTPFILKLRRRKFDTGIMLSPGQQWKGGLIMAMAGISTRLGHTYPHLGNQTSHLFLNHFTDELPTTHDTLQNLQLIRLVATNYKLQTTNYHLNIPENYFISAQKLISSISSKPRAEFIGIHAGSAPNFTWKRWPQENFTQVARLLHQQHGYEVLIFGGPDEQAQKKRLQKAIGKNISYLVSSDLLTTAAVITHCRLFLSNDSGLMHLAAAVSLPTLGLFGPTDEAKTGPLGEHSYIIRAEGTKPVYDTEENYDLGKDPHPSLLKITPDMVISRINYIFDSSPVDS